MRVNLISVTYVYPITVLAKMKTRKLYDMKALFVKDLKAGMVLSSGTKVISDPINPREANGYITITVEYKDGQIKTQQWGKYTTVKILQKPLQS